MKAFAAVLVLALAAGAADDDPAADRDAIRADIDTIYQAFIHKDRAKVQATHDENWHGFLDGSTKMIRGIDQYMKFVGPMTSPYGMTSYKIRDFDILFQGDAAFVTFVTDIERNTPAGMQHAVQRLADFYVKKNGKWVQSGSNTSISPETIEAEMERPQPVSEGLKKSLLQAREAVWRAYFANDRAALDKMIPQELVVIAAGGRDFSDRKTVMDGSAAVAASGTKLVKLEFPETQIQLYGNSAMIYSTYSYDLERNGERSTHSGRVTELFVIREGRWVNPGWHMDGN